MADLPISGLPPVVTPLPADLILSTNDGISRGMSRQQLHTLEVGEILLLPNGSDASTPELQFPNSGVYEDALDQLAFAHAGLQVAHAVAPASGGMFVNNLSTGGGLERVLTTSDSASFGEYSGTFNGAGPTFPAATNQGDWFNCTNPGTIDGQPFVLGDILVALIDSPSTSTFAGNWTLVPHIGQADHLLLLNIGTNTHVQIDNHIADATIHFTEASIVHANIIGAGANSHAAIDSHIALTNEHIDWVADQGGTQINTNNLSPDQHGVTPASNFVEFNRFGASFDLDTLREPGQYGIGSAPVNGPTGATFDPMLVMASATDVTSQLVIPRTASRGLAYRGETSDVLGAWHYAGWTVTPANAPLDQYASHIADGTIHFTQAAISITASQISDFAAAVSSNAAVAANTAKVSNVSTALSVGTVNTTTFGITSDGGANDVIIASATGSLAGVMPSAKFNEVVANNAKVSNATHTGEVTGSVALTIAADVVDNTNLSNMSANTVKVRAATAGDPQDLLISTDRILGHTAASGVLTALQGSQVNVMLPNFTSGLKGLAPASGGGTTNFLRADGTWAAPGGGGTIGGSITDNQIAVGAATADDIEGSANLIYDGTRLTLGFGVAQGEIMLDADATTARGSIFTKTVGLVDTKILTRGSSLDQLNFGAAAFSLNFVGSKATYNQSIFQVEQAAAQADVAAQGQWWVNNSGFNPSMPFFTGESGDDMNLARDLWDNGTLQAQATATGIDVRDTLKVGSLGSTTGVLKLGEQANADVDEAGYGQFWVDNLTPNIPMFTNDAGTDGTLARLEFAQTWTQNQTFAANVDLVLATTGEVRFGTTTVFGFNGADSFIEMNGNNNDLFITVESGGGNSTAAAFRGQSAGNLAELYANNLIQLATQNNASTGNTSGAQVKSHNAVLYDVGYNQLPVFNDNVSDTLEAAHSGQVAFKDATTARTLTLASNASLDFPVHGMTTVINAFTSGNYTITEGASTTLYYLDGATRTDTAGGATVGPGGVANIWRESATVYYIWGTGITP